jgi:tetratricopeptide (TPR) repeat protein
MNYNPLIATQEPLTPAQCISLAEKYYKNAIKIRPKYWDASINLAGLLSAQLRFHEALQVYYDLENAMDVNEGGLDRLRFDSLNPVHASMNDLVWIHSIVIKLQTQLIDETFPVDKRRDLYFSKGNIYYTLKDVSNAKIEYFKGLIVSGVDMHSILSSSMNNMTPSKALGMTYRFVDPTLQSISTTLQTLAKIYQDFGDIPYAISLYYKSLEVAPNANSCNNLGILLSSFRLNESIEWYELGLRLDPNHVHLYTNLGSALKDRGQLNEGKFYSTCV